eukprot:gene22285-26884_t
MQGRGAWTVLCAGAKISATEDEVAVLKHRAALFSALTPDGPRVVNGATGQRVTLCVAPGVLVRLLADGRRVCSLPSFDVEPAAGMDCFCWTFSLVPYLYQNQSPRTLFGCNVSPQCIQWPATVVGDTYVPAHCSKPLVTTMAQASFEEAGYVEPGEACVVAYCNLEYTYEDCIMEYAITVTYTEELQSGDKLATLHGQKGVVLLCEAEDMPWIVYNGREVQLDAVISVVSLVKRGTAGQESEGAMGAATAESGRRAFVSHDSPVPPLKTGTLIDGRTGALMTSSTGALSEVSWGVCRLCPLIHISSQKQFYTGSRGHASGSGRTRSARVKLGEMEMQEECGSHPLTGRVCCYMLCAALCPGLHTVVLSERPYSSNLVPPLGGAIAYHPSAECEVPPTVAVLAQDLSRPITICYRLDKRASMCATPTSDATALSIGLDSPDALGPGSNGPEPGTGETGTSLAVSERLSSESDISPWSRQQSTLQGGHPHPGMAEPTVAPDEPTRLLAMAGWEIICGHTEHDLGRLVVGCSVAELTHGSARLTLLAHEPKLNAAIATLGSAVGDATLGHTAIRRPGSRQVQGKPVFSVVSECLRRGVPVARDDRTPPDGLRISSITTSVRLDWVLHLPRSRPIVVPWDDLCSMCLGAYLDSLDEAPMKLIMVTGPPSRAQLSLTSSQYANKHMRIRDGTLMYAGSPAAYFDLLCTLGHMVRACLLDQHYQASMDVINTRARLQSHAALLVSNAETYQRIVESTRAALLAFAQDMDSNPQSPAEAARQLAAALEGNSRVVGTLTDAVSGVLSMDRFNPSAAIPLASQ